MIADAIKSAFAERETNDIEFHLVPIDLIAPDRSQDRKEFDMVALQELADSISQLGVAQPIIVRPVADYDRHDLNALATDEGCELRIIGGERRWRASKLAGMETIPCMVRFGLSKEDVFVLQAQENLQRKDLTLSEEITLCWRAVGLLGMDAAVDRLNMSKPWISVRAGVMDMPYDIRQLVNDRVIRDVQIANSLGQLWAIDAVRAQQIIKQFTHPPEYTNGNTPSREDVATAVRVAKARQQQLEQQRAESARLEAEEPPATAKLTGTGSYKELLDGIEKLHKQADDLVEAERVSPKLERKNLHAKYLKTMQPECEAFAERLRLELNRSLGITVPTERESLGWDRAFVVPAVRVDHTDLLDRMPEQAFDARYTASISGPAEVFARFNECITESMPLNGTLEGVSDEQAAAIEKILGRPIKWHNTMTTDGEHYRTLIRTLDFADDEYVKVVKPAKKAEQKPAADFDLPADVLRWIKRTLKKSVGNRIASGELHNLYQADCEQRGVPAMVRDDKRWSAAFKAAGYFSMRSDGTKILDVAVKKAAK